MKVKKLIKALRDFDQDAVIILAKDPAENAHSPLCDMWFGSYSAKRGIVGLQELTEELAAEGYTEDDVLKGKKAVILIPEN